MCIRRTLAHGRLNGLASGLGAATADGIYGGIAAFGLTAISGVLLAGQVWLRLIGGVFLLALGIRTLLARPASEAVRAADGGLLGAYASTFLLTITNPVTILAFTAIFAGLGVGLTGSGGYAPAALVVAGVFSGSALWWLILSGGVSLLSRRISGGEGLPPGLLRWVNRGAGVIIGGFGIAVLVSLIGG